MSKPKKSSSAAAREITYGNGPGVRRAGVPVVGVGGSDAPVRDERPSENRPDDTASSE